VQVHWSRIGNRSILWTNDDNRIFQSNIKKMGVNIDTDSSRGAKGQLYLVIQVGSSFQRDYPNIPVILEKGRYLVVDVTSEQLMSMDKNDENCWMLRPLPPNQVISDVVRPERQEVIPWIKSLAASISLSTYQSYLTQLTTFSTRHSLSSFFRDATTWASDQLNNFGYSTRLDQINLGTNKSYNVIADLKGHGNGLRDIVIISAHLDSINSAGGLESKAPGADDNASGSAGLIEIARILASHNSIHDLRLILFGGEEQRLVGSRRYVDTLSASERGRIRAVINMDMIATLNTNMPTVLLEGASLSQTIIDNLAASASTYTSLKVEQSLNPFASDHVPFIDVHIPAVLTIEGADRSNTNVHTANDTIDYINYDLALEIIRMNLATAALLLGNEEL
jgi:Zn-dependent M28 family amino/carboxypeptidase